MRQTARVLQMAGMFDVPPAETSEQRWEVDFCPPQAWSIGVIVGPSGSGKTTIATELAKTFGERLLGGKDEEGREAPMWAWPGDRSLLDGFPSGMGMKEITGLLSSVGFSSPPSTRAWCTRRWRGSGRRRSRRRRGGRG